MLPPLPTLKRSTSQIIRVTDKLKDLYYICLTIAQQKLIT